MQRNIADAEADADTNANSDAVQLSGFGVAQWLACGLLMSSPRFNSHLVIVDVQSQDWFSQGYPFPPSAAQAQESYHPVRSGPALIDRQDEYCIKNMYKI